MIFSINEIPELHKNLLMFDGNKEQVLSKLGYCITAEDYCYKWIVNGWKYINVQEFINWYNGMGKMLVATMIASMGTQNNNVTRVNENSNNNEITSTNNNGNVLDSEINNNDNSDDMCNYDWSEMADYRYQYDIESIVYRSINVGINSTGYKDIVWLPDSIIDDIDISSLNEESNNLFKVNIMFRSKSNRIKPIFIFHDEYIEMLLPSIMYNKFIKFMMGIDKEVNQWNIFDVDSKLLLRMTGYSNYNSEEFYTM